MDGDRQHVDELEKTFGDIKGTMYGLDEVARLCLVALCADGHVLLEGNPGLGKTTLVKTLAEHLGLAWGRIQFTPDLMPLDITGSERPDFSGGDQSRFTMLFQPGPIFTSLLLADEINRASPKTQSAMLEAMAERQVTVLGQTHRMPDPFMVLATQNPLDYEGTYELPRAQADRFMMKLFVHLPGKVDLLKIMDKDTGPRQATPASAAGRADAVDNEKPLRRRMVSSLRHNLRAQTAAGAVREHIATIVLASNGRLDERASRNNKALNERGRELFEYGYSPRAATALLLAAQGWVYLWPKLNPYVTQADGAALAAVLRPVLRHRTVLREAADGSGRPGEAEAFIDNQVRDFARLCAAHLGDDYCRVFDMGIDPPR